MSKGIDAKEAVHGDQMIEVKLWFWTNGLADGKDQITKHAWSSDVVRIKGNKSHGIVPREPIPFNRSWM